MKPPCVRRGGLMPYCCAHTRGAIEHRGRSKRRRCATRTPTIPPFGEKRPSSGGAHRAGQQANRQQCKRYRCVPVLPCPPFGGTPKLRAAHIGPSKTAPNCAYSNSHGPACRRSSSELQVSMHSGPGQRHDANEGWVMRKGVM